MKSFQEAYEKVSDSFSTYQNLKQTVDNINNYQKDVEESLLKCIEDMKKVANSNKAYGTLKGDVAEFWHAGTLKTSAIKIGSHSNITVEVPRKTFINSPDIVASDGMKSISAQSKYWSSAEKTLEQFVKSDYYSMQKLAASEQLPLIKQTAFDNYNIYKDSNPNLALKYKNIYETINSNFTINKKSSLPLSSKEANQLVEELRYGTFDRKKYNLLINEFAKLSDISKTAGKAAFNAAVISAFLKAAPHLLKFIKDILKEGELNVDNLINARDEALKGAATGALMGGISAAIVASGKLGLLGESAKNINPDVVSACVIVAINAIINSYKLCRKEINESQFAEYCIRDCITVTIAFVGMGIGQTLIPVPFLGAFIGGLIGSIMGTVVYEGAKIAIFSFCIKFNIAIPILVKQDFNLPLQILKKCGFDLIEPDLIEPHLMKPDLMKQYFMEPDLMNLTHLKRGIISFNTIGYIY